MKKTTICLFLCSTVLFTSCIGSFSAFNKLRDWNENATDNKFGNELIFIALWVLPVYGIVTLSDLVIFNAIEFWDGDNPIAMNEGDSETKTIISKGSTYKITATKNRFHVAIIEGKRKGETTNLVYTPENKSWNTLDGNGKKIKLSSLNKGLKIAYFPNGESMELPNQLTKVAQMDALQTKADEYLNCELTELGL